MCGVRPCFQHCGLTGVGEMDGEIFFLAKTKWLKRGWEQLIQGEGKLRTYIQTFRFELLTLTNMFFKAVQKFLKLPVTIEAAVETDGLYRLRNFNLK